MSTNGKILYVGETSRPAALDLVLEGQGYQISTASDINAALRMLQARDFEAMIVEARLLDVDLVQCSVSMPAIPDCRCWLSQRQRDYANAVGFHGPARASE